VLGDGEWVIGDGKRPPLPAPFLGVRESVLFLVPRSSFLAPRSPLLVPRSPLPAPRRFASGQMTGSRIPSRAKSMLVVPGK
jgi:hypothetical protein